MVVAATGALVAGAAMAAAGTAAAIKAQQMRTKPRGVSYGGSPEALYNSQNRYGEGTNQGAILRNNGIADLAAVGENAGDQSAYGRSLMDNSLANFQNNKQTTAQYMADLWHKSQAAENAQVAGAQFDRAARQNTALAQVGGPQAMRAAMAANTDAAVQAEQQRAISDVAMASQYAQQASAADTARRNFYLQQAGLGAQLSQGGLATQVGAYSPAVQAGLITQGQFLGAEQNVNQAQLEADLDYERRRQADQQRKSQNLWSLGSSLISGGGQLMRSGYGGGGGGGG